MSYYLNYYVELKNASVNDEIAILRAEFRDMLLEYGEDNIYDVYKILKEIMFDELFLLVQNEHSNNFKNLNEYQFKKNIDDDIANVLKKMNINYYVDSKPLQHFSDEQLREELYKRNTNENVDEEEVIDEFINDLDLSHFNDESLFDLDLDEDDDDELNLDEDYDISLSVEPEDSMKIQLLEFMADYCQPIGGYITTAKFKETLGCFSYKYKPFLDELIEKELVVMSEPMHNYCRINCYSVTAKGYQTLSEFYLFDDVDKNDKYNKTAALLRKYNSDIQTSKRLVDLFKTYDDKVKFDDLKVVQVDEDFDEILKKLDKPVSENDIAIHYKDECHSFKYTDLRIFASMFKRLESYSDNDEYGEVIEALRKAYVNDTRSLMKYMRVISLNHKHELDTWFKQKTSRCIDSFLGDSSLVHEDGLKALVSKGWIEKGDIDELYRVTELGKKYL